MDLAAKQLDLNVMAVTAPAGLQEAHPPVGMGPSSLAPRLTQVLSTTLCAAREPGKSKAASCPPSRLLGRVEEMLYGQCLAFGKCPVSCLSCPYYCLPFPLPSFLPSLHPNA